MAGRVSAVVWTSAALGAAAAALAQRRRRAAADARKDDRIHVTAAEAEEAQRWRPPGRETRISALREGHFDVLVIGGGATGAGCALDASSRGLRTALVERGDWASGTSSKSTKLVHGGMRYLELAVRTLDAAQLRLVREALAERAALLRLAPHVAGEQAIVVPVSSWLRVPYYWAGAKAYDALSGRAGLSPSRWVPQSEVLRRLPLLRPERAAAGGVLFHDGRQNDARTCVALVLSALRAGAVCVSHAEALALLRGPGGCVVGARVRDRLSGAEFDVRARGVINAAGPFCDGVRRMAYGDGEECTSGDAAGTVGSGPSGEVGQGGAAGTAASPGKGRPDTLVQPVQTRGQQAFRPAVQPSVGTHIVVRGDARLTPADTGLLDADTPDGRVVFVLPFEGATLVGTTDRAAETPTHVPGAGPWEPPPGRDDAAFLLRELRAYFRVGRVPLGAAWAGLRPLVAPGGGGAAQTASIVRSHEVLRDAPGMVSIVGGKWTTYRAMAQDAVDALAAHAGLAAPPSRTASLVLVGAHAWDPDGADALQRRHGLAADVARHLHRSYGDRADRVAALSSDISGRVSGLPLDENGHARLSTGHPYLAAEVLHALRDEDAHTPADVLLRRTRLGHVDAAAALAAGPAVVDMLVRERGLPAACAGEMLAQLQADLAGCGLGMEALGETDAP